MGSVCSSRRTPVLVTEFKQEHTQNEQHQRTESNSQIRNKTHQEPIKNVTFKEPSTEEIKVNNTNTHQIEEKYTNTHQNEEKKPGHKKESEVKKQSLKITPFTDDQNGDHDFVNLKDNCQIVSDQIVKPDSGINKIDLKSRENHSATLLNDSVKNQFRIYSKSNCSVKSEKLVILHFNDVYNIESRDIEPVGGAARFVTKIKSFQDEPLILFSGDCLNPSLSILQFFCYFMLTVT